MEVEEPRQNVAAPPAEEQDPSVLIMRIIKSNPGITDGSLKMELSRIIQIGEPLRIQCLMVLNHSGYVKIKQDASGNVIYYEQNPAVNRVISKLDRDEKRVYEAIEASRNKGMSKIELKRTLGMISNVVNPSVKKLEKFGLIKSFKPKNKKRNIYILIDLEPDVDIIGGEFYKEGQLDYSMINSLGNKIERYIASNDSASKQDIMGYVVSSIEAGKHLKEKDIDKLINILILDDRIEDVSTYGFGKYVISRNRRAFDTRMIGALPCLTCPVSNECRPGYKISPENCIYFDDW